MKAMESKIKLQVMNEYNKRNRNNEAKVNDTCTYKRCMTRTATNTIKESDEDGKLKVHNCNVAT